MKTISMEMQSGETPADAGLFTWRLANNALFGDTAMANLYGLDPKVTVNGPPIERYLAQIVDQDRAAAAKAIYDAVLNGDPYHHQYRVTDAAGDVVTVNTFGRCFRDNDGEPSLYAGIAFSINADNVSDDPVLDHCHRAYEAAVKTGRKEVAEAIELIIEDLGANAARSEMGGTTKH